MLKKLVVGGLALSGSQGDDDAVRSRRSLITQVRMFEFFNPNFDFDKYWLYGCSCYSKGKKGFNGGSLGAPVDQLDNVCQSYRNCLKCAVQEHGSWCRSDSMGYGYKLNQFDRTVTCTDSPGTCHRAICECDKHFTKDHADNVKNFNADYHEELSSTGWTTDQCEHSGGGGGGSVRGGGPACCGGKTSPFHIYNPRFNECCEDGSVVMIGEC
jgi:hypothetical protein